MPFDPLFVVALIRRGGRGKNAVVPTNEERPRMDGSHDLDIYACRTVAASVAVLNSLPPCRRRGEPRLSAGIRWDLSRTE